MIQQSRVQEQARGSETARIEMHDPGVAYRQGEVMHVSWGAVIAGTVAAIAAQVIFATLGLAIGLSVPGTAATAEGMGIFAGIWWLITGIISLFIGGWVAGRYTGFGQEMDAGLHGVMTWALATTLSVLFVTTVGGMLAGGAVGAMANDISPAAVAQATSPDATGTAAQDNGVTAADAQQAGAGTAWWTFFALLLGLIAAGVGGYIATPQEFSSGFDRNSGNTATGGRVGATT